MLRIFVPVSLCVLKSMTQRYLSTFLPQLDPGVARVSNQPDLWTPTSIRTM